MNDERTHLDLRGAAALITGGSRGLGAALAAELAARGARVALVARGESALEETARRITEAGGVAYAIPADVADKSAPHRIAAIAADLVGPIDLLVHAASTLGPVPMPTLADTPCEALADVLETNVIGPFRLTKIVAGSMALRGRGVVVHVSSDAAVEPYPRWGAYGASKAAHDHLQRVWAAELAGRGVTFLSVDPGEMDTAMHAAALPDADRSALARPEDVARRVVERLGARALASGARFSAAEAP